MKKRVICISLPEKPLDTYTNTYHGEHLYLKIEEAELERMDSSVFDELIMRSNKPLQIVLSSDETRLIGFLRCAGFELKRCCYEMDVESSDLAAPLQLCPEALFEAQRGTPEYLICAEKMYLHYCRTHLSVSPLTASPDEFAALLPEKALYSVSENGIEAGAFIEGNEIAYLFPALGERFDLFARAVLSHMFKEWDRIVFEADDTDPAAMRLKGMFSSAPAARYDTYIKAR